MSGPVPMVGGHHGTTQGIWDITTDAELPVGTRGVLPDGRVYYYAKNSAAAAIVAGDLLTTEVQTAQFTELAVNTAAVGDTTLTITLGSTAVTANEYQEGYIIPIDELGEGITYKIKAHPAASGTAACIFTLYDPIHVGFAAATTVQVVKNPWCDVVQAVAGQAHVPIGVSNVAVTAGNSTPYYFWCQTWGICSILQDEICAAGSEMTSGTTLVGAAEVRNLVTDPTVGVNIWTSADTERAPIFLQIAP